MTEVWIVGAHLKVAYVIWWVGLVLSAHNLLWVEGQYSDFLFYGKGGMHWLRLCIETRLWMLQFPEDPSARRRQVATGNAAS